MSISESTAERYTLADPDVRLMLQVRDETARILDSIRLSDPIELVPAGDGEEES